MAALFLAGDMGWGGGGVTGVIPLRDSALSFSKVTTN